MSAVSQTLLALQAVRELGFEQISLNFIYRLGIKSGYFRKITPARSLNLPDTTDSYFLQAPTREALARLLPEPPTIADGTLTPTFKLRRRELEARYSSQIELLYSESAVLEAHKAA